MLVVIALAGTALTACTPTPEPSPTPTAAFASEEEAFAAAEEVYRAYNDAVNRQRNGDEAADPLAFLTGDILESEVTAAQELDSAGIKIVGETNVTDFTGTNSRLDSVASVEATVCLDVTDARAIDRNGADVTAADRSNVYAVAVTFTGTPAELLISRYEVTADAKC
jgi:hypothetical protein